MKNTKFLRTGATVSGNATISACFFQDGSGLQLWDSDALLSNSLFVGNKGHLSVESFASAFVDNCLFVGSRLYPAINGGFASALFRNCAILNNSPYTPAINWGDGNLYLLNTTIAGNGLQRSSGAGGIDVRYNASAQVLNSIIWGNGSGAAGNSREEDQIRLVYGTSSLEIDYSIVEGWSGKFGGPGNTGNFGLDPMFADLDGPDDIPGTLDDNARLLPVSPAINAGFGTSQFQLPTDLDGHSRVLCGAVDIGAYEFGLGDYNCDQRVNMLDFALWPPCMTGPSSDPPGAQQLPPGCEAFDANADADVDLSDYAAFDEQFMK